LLIERKDVDSLVQFVNLVTEKGQFSFNANDAIQFAQLVVCLKDLKDKLDKQATTTQVTAPQPPQGAENGMVRRRS